MRTLRAGGSLLVLALFPVLVLGLIAALVWTAWAAFAGQHAGIGLKMLIIVVPFAYAVFTAVRQVLSVRPQPATGYEVSRGEHPRLWAAADEAAAAVGTEPAERLVVVGDVNAAVTQAAGRRELLVGLPLLATLTTGELRSVLAHEFGHFGAGHTRLTALTWRAHALMGELVQHTEGTLGWLIGGYAKLARRLTASSSRDQEWEADAYAARLTNPATAASAMRRVVETDRAMGFFMRTHFPLTGVIGRRAPIAEGLQRTMAGRHDQLAGTARAMIASLDSSDPYDSHPPMRERIAAFEAMPATPDQHADDDRPAYELLSDAMASFDPIELALTGDNDPVAGWDEVATLAGRQVSEQRTTAYLAQVPFATPPRTLRDVLDLIPQAQTRQALAVLLPEGTLKQERDGATQNQLVDFVAIAIASSLVRSGRGHFVLDWAELWNLTHVDGTRVDLPDRIVAAVSDEAALADLKTYVASLGLDLDAPLPEADPTGAPVSGG